MRLPTLLVACLPLVTAGNVGASPSFLEPKHAPLPRHEVPRVNSRTISRCVGNSFSSLHGLCIKPDHAAQPLPPELRDVRAFGEPAVLPLQGPLGHTPLSLSPKDVKRK